LLEKTPLFLLAAGSCVMTVLSQSQSGALKSLGAYPLGPRCSNALNSVLVYLGQTVWPTDLAAYYPYPRQGLPWETILLEAILFLGISGAAVYLIRSRPYLLVGWLWYLAALVPVIGLVQVGRQAHADRYTYVPLIGIFLALVWGVSDLLGPRRRVVQVALLAGSLAVCVVLTRVQAGYWANSRALWQHALAVTDNNAFARMAYGQALGIAQLPEAALEQYAKSLEIDPEMDRAWLLLAQLHESQRRWDDALDCYRQAAALAPSNKSYQASVSRLLAQHSAEQDHKHP
jgi:tetratricopeptide (TPR) repeat protein